MPAINLENELKYFSTRGNRSPKTPREEALLEVYNFFTKEASALDLENTDISLFLDTIEKCKRHITKYKNDGRLLTADIAKLDILSEKINALSTEKMASLDNPVKVHLPQEPQQASQDQQGEAKTAPTVHNLSQTDSQGRTALHYACLLKDTKAIGALIAQNANWNTTDDNGQTPIDFLFYDKVKAESILKEAKDAPLRELEEQFFNTDPKELLRCLMPAMREDFQIGIITKNVLNQMLLDQLKPLFTYIEDLDKDIKNSPLVHQGLFAPISPEYRNTLYQFACQLYNIASHINEKNIPAQIIADPNSIALEAEEKRQKILELIDDALKERMNGPMRTDEIETFNRIKIRLNALNLLSINIEIGKSKEVSSRPSPEDGSEAEYKISGLHS